MIFLSIYLVQYLFSMQCSILILKWIIYRADQDDVDKVSYNRAMLPAYYGLLRLCYQHKKSLARHSALPLEKLRIISREQMKSPPYSALKHLRHAIRRLVMLLPHNLPQMRSLALDVLIELVRNPNLEVIAILCPLLLTCHIQVQDSSKLIGPIKPYFLRRSSTKAQLTNIVKNHPLPSLSMSSMVQMGMPQSQLIQRCFDKKFDAGIGALYRSYHDFLDVMIRMTVNMNHTERVNSEFTLLSQQQRGGHAF